MKYSFDSPWTHLQHLRMPWWLDWILNLVGATILFRPLVESEQVAWQLKVVPIEKALVMVGILMSWTLIFDFYRYLIACISHKWFHRYGPILWFSGFTTKDEVIQVVLTIPGFTHATMEAVPEHEYCQVCGAHYYTFYSIAPTGRRTRMTKGHSLVCTCHGQKSLVEIREAWVLE